MKAFSLNKGHNIQIKGAPESVLVDAPRPEKVALKPSDFKKIKLKLSVKEGDRVKAGSSLFFNKTHPDFHFTSPVSGEVVAINRGAKRVLLEVVVKPDAEQSFESFETISKKDLLTASREKILQNLLRSGLLAHVTSRPYGVSADPTVTPRDIFISAFNTAPLHADISLILQGNEDAFQAGLNALTRLTEGSVYLSYEGGNAAVPAAVKNAENVMLNTFTGKHPAGNVGIQIHHIKPINNGETVWTLKPAAVIRIGKLFLEGKLSGEAIVALGGECANERKHFKTFIGAQISSFIQGDVNISKPVRFISGDVLTGTQIAADGFLGFNDSQVTVIPESTENEFLSWLAPGSDRESFSYTYLSRLSSGKTFSHNTGMHGGLRAIVQTGLYESVLPMDLYPAHLVKSIMYQDLEEMVGLGILEVIEEDLALCEYVCVSKIEVQKILREGLDACQKEL